MTFVKGDERWYRDPKNPTKTYPGVTSILSARSKPAIENAKRNAIIEHMARNRKTLALVKNQQEIFRELKGREGEDVYLPDWRIARSFGTAVHQVIENIEAWDPLGKDVEFVQGSTSYPVTNTFTEWVPRVWEEFKDKHDFELIASECPVYSDRNPMGWAGRFDIICWLRLDPKGPRKITILDMKTNRGGPHGDVAVQNLAYGTADFMVDHDGSVVPVPKVEQSAVFWTHENTKKTPNTVGWNLFPLDYDRAVWDDWQAFRRMHYFTHVREHEVIGEPLNGPTLFTQWVPWD